MGWKSFGAVGFDLGPLVQGQTRIAKLKSACNSLIKTVYYIFFYKEELLTGMAWLVVVAALVLFAP